MNSCQPKSLEDPYYVHITDPYVTRLWLHGLKWRVTGLTAKHRCYDQDEYDIMILTSYK